MLERRPSPPSLGPPVSVPVEALLGSLAGPPAGKCGIGSGTKAANASVPGRSLDDAGAGSTAMPLSAGSLARLGSARVLSPAASREVAIVCPGIRASVGENGVEVVGEVEGVEGVRGAEAPAGAAAN